MPPKMPEIDWGGVMLHGLLAGFWMFVKLTWPYLILIALLICLKWRYVDAPPRRRRNRAPEYERPPRPLRRASTPASGDAPVPLSSAPQAEPAVAVCVTCGKAVSAKVEAYCRDHGDRFGGRIYCFTHQRSARDTALKDGRP